MTSVKICGVSKHSFLEHCTCQRDHMDAYWFYIRCLRVCQHIMELMKAFASPFSNSRASFHTRKTSSTVNPDHELGKPINSLVPGRCRCNHKLKFFKLFSMAEILSISCELALRCKPQNLAVDWFRKCLGAVRQQSVTTTMLNKFYSGHAVSLGHSELASKHTILVCRANRNVQRLILWAYSEFIPLLIDNLCILCCYEVKIYHATCLNKKAQGSFCMCAQLMGDDVTM